MHPGMYVAICVVQKQISTSFFFLFLFFFSLFFLLFPPPKVSAKTARHRIWLGPVKIWSNVIGQKGQTTFSEPKSGSCRYGNLDVYPQGYQAHNARFSGVHRNVHEDVKAPRSARERIGKT